MEHLPNLTKVDVSFRLIFLVRYKRITNEQAETIVFIIGYDNPAPKNFHLQARSAKITAQVATTLSF